MGVDVHKFIIGVNYNLLNPKSKCFLVPSIGIGVLQSKENGWEFLQRDDHVNGPDYVQTEPIRGEPLKTTQVIPTIGLKTGIVFWKRLEFGLDIQGVYAFKSYQNMYLDYEYLGEPQPTAVYETTGTGIFTAIFLGY